MSFRDALNAFARHAPSEFGLPKMPATVEANRRLARLYGETGARRPLLEGLDDVSWRLARALKDGDPLASRDLLRAPWCIWATDAPLSRQPTLVERLLARIVEEARRHVYRALASAWLHYFEQDGLCVGLVGDFLKEHLDDLGHPWSEAHGEYQIFDAEAGPARIVDAAFKNSCTPDAILTALGFRDRHLASSYCERLFLVGFERRAFWDDIDPLSRLYAVQRWMRPRDSVRIETLRSTAVRIALDSFEKAMPEEGLRDGYLDFVLGLLGDPRQRPERWTACRTSEAIARRWLTEQSLRQFFSVVEAISRTERWSYRQAFWKALYDKGAIEGAWTAFESSGGEKARALFGQNAAFGRMEGMQPGHAVLLISIRGLTIAEWSHNNPCSIWDGAVELGPKLYRASYSPRELKKLHRGDDSPVNLASQGVFWHHGHERYLWQSRIAGYLKDRRDIAVSPSDYWVGE